MTNWIETSNLERKIILAIHKESKPISEISKELNKSIQTISKTIERMKNQDLIVKSHQYRTDARKIEIELNKKRIKIEKAHTFYLNYYILISIFLIISGIIWVVIKNPLIFLGSIIIAIPLFLMMFYQVYIMEDKVIVEKNPKPRKVEKKLEIEEKVDGVD